MRLFIRFSYDGSKFSGFQRQKNVRTVQGEIENILTKIYGIDINIKGSGRTDAGVHALNQYAHFDVDYKYKKLKKLLNKYLKDIYIKKVYKVNENLHARFSPKKKTYIYKISYDQSLNSNYYLLQKRKLNINKMKTASKVFIGTHNFKNFVSGQRDNYETTIFKIKIKQRNNLVILIFVGVGFYRYMVRNLVGALLDVDKSKVTNNDLINMINKPDIMKQLSTAKSGGLYLKNIKY